MKEWGCGYYSIVKTTKHVETKLTYNRLCQWGMRKRCSKSCNHPYFKGKHTCLIMTNCNNICKIKYGGNDIENLNNICEIKHSDDDTCFRWNSKIVVILWTNKPSLGLRHLENHWKSRDRVHFLQVFYCIW